MGAMKRPNTDRRGGPLSWEDAVALCLARPPIGITERPTREELEACRGRALTAGEAARWIADRREAARPQHPTLFD